ncbi:hypothetical protein INT46_011074 [Mucor plumbeus]|uniref:N-acetyltransferase domain-containing protein n=1 Tax=Mucor plumbeus TaxID=97098 RepID=A0A8H7QVB0_9FUNG|nr:hypothetical protein INT46_011074 [Mucor plumbeus]
MTTTLTIKRYTSTSLFLKETEPFLCRNEFQNIFVLLMAQQEQVLEEKETQSNSYCGTVWDDQNQLVFALFNGKNNTILYGSLTQNLEAIDLLVDDLIASGTHSSLTFVRAFQPSLNRLYEQLQKHNIQLRIIDQVWAYESQKVTWSPRLLSIARDSKTELKLATIDDLPLLTEWTLEFFVHLTTENGMDDTSLPDPEEAVRDALASKFAYILCVNSAPVSMCWKKRPTKTECALAYVYTTKECRNKGYGAVCVGLLTETLLQNRRSVNLFVVRERDPVNNMYAGIGYKLIGEAAKLSK